MKLWTRANTLWLIATVLIVVALRLNQPLQIILLIIAGCVGGAATHQRFRNEFPAPGQETIIDRLMGAVLVFFIVMVLIMFSSIPFFELMFNNTFTPTLFVIIMLCFAAIGALLQFFYGTGKNASGGLSKSFIIVVTLLLTLGVLYATPLILQKR
ncbi:MAG: hypothetical protein PHD04_00210 [Candidatus Pacebacteria bacterium]|nr:hypothetical protein [Candidatus Paceibacterota bacterium]